MKLVIVESPYAGDVAKNLAYVRACMRDCLLRGEAPYASHALYTQLGVLDDTVHEERRLGMEAGFEWSRVEGVTRVFYLDLGRSRGMVEAHKLCIEENIPYEDRVLGPLWRNKHVGVCLKQVYPDGEPDVQLR